MPEQARFVLRLKPAVAVQLGLDMPINRCIRNGDRLIARLGPDEWLLLGPDDGGECERSLAAHVHSLVDISHRNLSFTVSGPHAREIISAGCPLDLRDAQFPPGMATRTVLGKVEIVLMRPSAEETFLIECVRSFGPYVQDFLSDAAMEF